MASFAKLPCARGRLVDGDDEYFPAPMKQLIEAQVRSGRYSNVSDFIRDLIRREQERVEKIAHMQRLVDDARESGISDETMQGIRERAIREAGVSD